MLQRNWFLIPFLIFFHVIVAGCDSEESVVPPSTIDPPETVSLSEDEKVALENVKMDSGIIENMVKAVTDQEYPNIHSILIVKDEVQVFEKYFPGNDENWGYNMGRVNHTKETLHDLRSITKSVVATCIGVAIDQGKIESVNQNIFDFFPDYQQFNTGSRAEITIKDLLTMTPGIKWDETSIPYTNPNNPEIQLTNSNDPIAFVLSQPMNNQPGETFIYNGGATQLLAGIIAYVSGLEVDKFAEEFLFSPLEIENYQWHRYSNSGLPAATSGLRLRSRDLMKFGLLYHNKGNWGGDEIFSESWVEESFKEQIDKPNQENGFFGYHFHIHPPFTSMGKSITHVAAVGNGDQRIFFNEEDNLMVVITAGNYNNVKTKNSLALMKNFIYPSFL